MKFWIKFVVVFFSLFLDFSLLPCGGDGSDYFDHDFFIKEVIFNKTELEEYNNYTYLFDSIDLFKEQNLVEWEKFFEKKIERDIIQFWLYGSKLAEIDEAIFYLENKTPPTIENVKIRGKSFFKYPKEAKAFFYYVGFARRNEVFTTKKSNYDYWGEEHRKEIIPNKETVNLQNQIKGGISLYQNEKFQFIKERYIFQLVRSYYLNAEYEKSIQFWKEHFGEIRLTDSMKWRTLGYVAASYTKQKRIGEANYIYSLLYTNSPNQKDSAYSSFQPMEDADWVESLKLTKSKDEKIILWYLFGKRFDIPKAMNEIYLLNPNSKYLNRLLIYGIKRLSYPVFGFGIRYWDYENLEMKKIIPLNDKALIKNVNSIANQDKVKNKFGWKIAAAYLNYLSMNFKEGDQFLESAFKLKGNVEVFEKQYQITSLLGKLLQMETIDEKSEMTILPEMKFLFSKDKNISEDLNLNYSKNWIRGLLGVFYARKGELEKAEWIQRGTIKNRFSNLENTKRMIDFLEDNAHSPLIQVMLQNPTHSYNDYLLLLGIRYAQVEDLENSLKVFEKIKDSYWEHKNIYYSDIPFMKDPFQIKIKDSYKFDYNNKIRLPKYNHKTFIQEMIRLKKEAESNTNKSSKNYFKLANAFYNMNYFGTGGFYYNPIHCYNWYYGWAYLSDPILFPEFSSTIALKYYLLARDNSNSKEFKAKMTFMAAKCEQNEWYLTKDYKPSHRSWSDEKKQDAKDFQPGKYFQELRDIYSDTKYHSEIIKECSYYARYWAKKSEL